MMSEKERELLRIRREIEANLSNCERTFEIARNGDVDPLDVMREMLERGSCYHFMLDSSGYYTLSSDRKVTFYMKYSQGRYTLRSMLADVKRKATAIRRALIRPEMSHMLRALVLHNYLVDTVEYDYDYDDSRIRDTFAHSSYGALIKGKAVCQGIANAYKILMDSASVECYNVHGDALPGIGKQWGGHAWNIMATRPGRYAFVDVTWDIGWKEQNRYQCFIKSAGQMRSDHRWDYTLYPRAVGDERALQTLEEELSAKYTQLRVSGVPERYLTI